MSDETTESPIPDDPSGDSQSTNGSIEGNVPVLGEIVATAIEPLFTSRDIVKERTRYKKLSARATELQTAIEENKADLKIILREMSELAHIVIPPPDPKQNQRDIMTYIKSQNALRLDRLSKRSAILKGLKLEDVLPGPSKLDQAMAPRKAARGMVRPNIPPMVPVGS